MHKEKVGEIQYRFTRLIEFNCCLQRFGAILTTPKYSMADYSIINNKSIALVVWNTENENDAHIYLGEIVQKGEDYYFVNEPQKWDFRLDKDKLDELSVVTEDMKEMLLNADLCLQLTIASIPDGSQKGFSPTGMKWHQ